MDSYEDDEYCSYNECGPGYYPCREKLCQGDYMCCCRQEWYGFLANYLLICLFVNTLFSFLNNSIYFHFIHVFTFVVIVVCFAITPLTIKKTAI